MKLQFVLAQLGATATVNKNEAKCNLLFVRRFCAVLFYSHGRRQRGAGRALAPLNFHTWYIFSK